MRSLARLQFKLFLAKFKPFKKQCRVYICKSNQLKWQFIITICFYSKKMKRRKAKIPLKIRINHKIIALKTVLLAVRIRGRLPPVSPPLSAGAIRGNKNAPSPLKGEFKTGGGAPDGSSLFSCSAIQRKQETWCQAEEPNCGHRAYH